MKSMKHLRIPAITTVLILLTFAAQRTLVDACLLRQKVLNTSTHPNEILPNVRTLRRMALGYPQVLADYYWMRALEHFGETKQHALLYPMLEPLLRRVIALDPKFASAYQFAGTALTLEGMPIEKSAALLGIGVKERPDLWRIHFLYGFVNYHYLQQYEIAALALSRAASLPGAPSFLPALASVVSAQAGSPEVGLRLLDAQLTQRTDPKVRAALKKERKLLLLEYQILSIEKALRRYQKQYGKPADNLDLLVQTGILRAIPTDPFGGHYTRYATNKVRTSSNVERLHLKPKNVHRGKL